MATNINWRRKFLRSGVAFTDAGANDIKMYVSTNVGAIGAEVGSLTYTAGGLWNIDIDIDTYTSNYYALRYTLNGADWFTMDSTKGSGCAPLFIDLENHMPLTGDTMSGNIVADDNSVTSVNSITFNDTAGTITGIQNQNLIDKLTDETISGNWTFSGDCELSGSNSVTGITNFTTDKLLVNSVIATPYTYLVKTIDTIASNADIDGVIFTSDCKMEVVSIDEVHEVKATAACKLQVERLSGTEATGAGDDMLTDNGGAGFDLNANARTIQAGTLDAASIGLSANDRIGLVSTGAEAGLQGVHLTIKLKYSGV